MAKYHRVEHLRFGQLLRFRLHHQNGAFGSGDNEVKCRICALGS